MAQDPYQTLGVSRSATSDEIRRAYRRKAKELHPDLHPDDAAKAEAFKSVSSAFEILGDDKKRAQFDRGEIDERGNPKGFPGEGFGGSRGPQGGFQGDPFEDILSGMFGGGRRRPGPRKGADLRYRVEIAFEDSVLGAKRDMTMGDGRTLTVSIPAGIETGKTLRLKSQGQRSAFGGPPGDALLEIVVRESSTWARDGNDLRMSQGVPLQTMILGGSVDVKMPGGSVTLKVPSGSNTGATLRLRGKGVQRQNKLGHLYVRLEAVIDNPDDPELHEWAKRTAT
ncbi:MAG: J domain-containing protein [Pseudomonadota bacterium]